MLEPILASHEHRAQRTEEVHFGLKIKRAGILFSTARIHRWSRSTTYLYQSLSLSCHLYLYYSFRILVIYPQVMTNDLVKIVYPSHHA
jgi:hypothetical protein